VGRNGGIHTRSATESNPDRVVALWIPPGVPSGIHWACRPRGDVESRTEMVGSPQPNSHGEGLALASRVHHGNGNGPYGLRVCGATWRIHRTPHRIRSGPRSSHPARPSGSTPGPPRRSSSSWSIALGPSVWSTHSMTDHRSRSHSVRFIIMNSGGLGHPVYSAPRTVGTHIFRDFPVERGAV
jgi:hypothetical protein